MIYFGLFPRIFLLRRHCDHLDPFFQDHLIVLRDLVRQYGLVLGQLLVNLPFKLLLHGVSGGRRLVGADAGEGVEVGEFVGEADRVVERILTGAVLGLVKRFLYFG